MRYHAFVPFSMSAVLEVMLIANGHRSLNLKSARESRIRLLLSKSESNGQKR